MDEFMLTAWSLDGKTRQPLNPKTLTWGGAWQDCSRYLRCTVPAASICPLGGAVQLAKAGAVIFSGTIKSRTRDATGQFIDLACYDRGFALKQNSTFIKVRKQTPESVTAQLCREYQIPMAGLAATGVRLSRNFFGVTLYQIIQTMYSLASEQNGKKYQIRFEGQRLRVAEKAIGPDSIRLTQGGNLLDCVAGDSIEDLINSVAVYDEKARRVAQYRSDPENLKRYGLAEAAIRVNDREDPAAQARELLREHGIKTTISATALGNPKLVTGTAVAVHEPTAQVDGLFWIQRDKHQLSRGVYTTDLELEFRNLMDKQQAGSLPTK